MFNMVTQDLLIRPAESTDGVMLSMLAKQTFEETFSDLFIGFEHELTVYVAQTFNSDKITASIQKSINRFFIVQVDQQPVGYIKLKLNHICPVHLNPSSMQIQKIYVKKEFHGLSIGKRLLHHALNEGYQLGIDYAWLNVVQTNIRALTFYKQIGFDFLGLTSEKIGSQHFVYHQMGAPIDSLLVNLK